MTINKIYDVLYSNHITDVIIIHYNFSIIRIHNIVLNCNILFYFNVLTGEYVLAACASISLAVDVIKALQATVTVTVTVSGAVVGNKLQQSLSLPQSQTLTRLLTIVLIEVQRMPRSLDPPH